MNDNVPNEMIYTALLEIKGTLGEVKAAIAGNMTHTIAVSGKADAIRTELATHAEKDEKHYNDLDAHGKGSTAKFMAQIIAAVACAETIFHLSKSMLK